MYCKRGGSLVFGIWSAASEAVCLIPRKLLVGFTMICFEDQWRTPAQPQAFEVMNQS
uniref:Uncharacterized protein n=1 Tax=Manihot esculenta TaxID=3983 RepID=A0A2C9WDV7_MANES